MSLVYEAVDSVSSKGNTGTNRVHCGPDVATNVSVLSLDGVFDHVGP